MRKITAKINELDWDLFETMVNDVGLRRDAYLCKVLPAELELIAGQPWVNDDAGLQYLANLTRTLGKFATKVTLRIDAPLAKQIDEICAAKRLTRDALLGTIITFLIVRVLPHALVLAVPRKTLKHQTEAALRRSVVTRHPEYSDILEYWKDIRDPDFYKRKLHFTQERIEEGDRLLREFMRPTSTTRNRGSNSAGGK